MTRTPKTFRPLSGAANAYLQMNERGWAGGLLFFVEDPGIGLLRNDIKRPGPPIRRKRL